MNAHSKIKLAASFASPPAGKEAAWLKDLIAQEGDLRIHITPALAEAMLEYNTHNRKLRTARVKVLAVDLKNNKFIFNAETISFGSNGVMLNGAHRATMSVKTGLPFDSLVSFGLNPEAQKTMDCQSPRTAADVLSLLGYSHANEVVAISGYLQDWEKYDNIPTNSEYRANRTERVDYVLEGDGGSRILNALDSVPPTTARYKDLISRSVVATCYARFARDTSPDDVSKFIRSLVLGLNLELGDPIYMARRMLMELKDDFKKGVRYNHRTTPFEIIALAWNAWRRGQQVSRPFVLTGTLPAVEA